MSASLNSPCVSLSPELLRALPKADLHLHLDGSLRLPTLIELAKDRGVRLPARSVAGLKKKVFKERYRNLGEYLHGFAYTCAVLRDAEAVERASYELCLDCQADGVRYAEIRFAPQLNAAPGFGVDEVLAAAARGIARATAEFNQRSEVQSGLEPRFVAGILVCAMRHFSSVYGPRFATMFEAFPDLPQARIAALASEEVVRAAIRARDEQGLPVVGVDLAGQEDGFPAADHQRAFQLAHDAFLGKTVHAGEAYGPESIFQAVTDCYADRIGHGTWLFSSAKVSPEIPRPASYVRRLAQYLADRRITLEVCLSSNLQTLPSLRKMADHPFRRMLRERMSVTLCTDNLLISQTTLTQEYGKAVHHFQLSQKQVKELLVHGFKRAFFPGHYREKRRYVRQIMNYRDQVLAEF